MGSLLENPVRIRQGLASVDNFSQKPYKRLLLNGIGCG